MRPIEVVVIGTTISFINPKKPPNMTTKPKSSTSTNSLQDARAVIKEAIDSFRLQLDQKQVLIDGYRAESNALYEAPIGLDDYAHYVRLNMRAAAAGIVDDFQEHILSSSGGRQSMNKVSFGTFEDWAGRPYVFQDGFEPQSIEKISHWAMLCFLGGEAFEDVLIERIRLSNAARWRNEGAMPVAQRRERIAELHRLIAEEEDAKKALHAELKSLLD